MKHRSEQKELLDAEYIPQEDLYRNLYELDRINSLLGGHELTKNAFKQCVNRLKGSKLKVVELGSGGGDNLRVLADLARKNDWSVEFTGIDLKKDCIDYAEKQAEAYPEIRWIQADYRDYQPAGKIDILFSSLFCHHLNDSELIEYLKWNRRHARYFFINDLHRHPLAKASIATLTSLFSKSYLVKHDAPLSVARGLKKKEWLNLLEQAEIDDFEMTWRWAFRWLILGKGDER